MGRSWEDGIDKRTEQLVDEILEHHIVEELDSDTNRELDSIMVEAKKKS